MSASWMNIRILRDQTCDSERVTVGSDDNSISVSRCDSMCLASTWQAKRLTTAGKFTTMRSELI